MYNTDTFLLTLSQISTNKPLIPHLGFFSLSHNFSWMMAFCLLVVFIFCNQDTFYLFSISFSIHNVYFSSKNKANMSSLLPRDDEWILLTNSVFCFIVSDRLDEHIWPVSQFLLLDYRKWKALLQLNLMELNRTNQCL